MKDMTMAEQLDFVQAELEEAESYIGDLHEEIRDLTLALNEALRRLEAYDLYEREKDVH